jgi:pyruvate/2-oxoglutarate dehydrogenase complex dihydrolipoamide dehydrogenase (E3) component
MADPVLVTPFDEFNQILVDHVHPSSWVNPEPAPLYHLVVLGAGSAGLVAAAIAARLGARVALVERHLMGGDCLNTGCVPSKALLRAARAHQELRESATYGLRWEQEPQIDGAAVMKRVRERRARIAPRDAAERFKNLGVDVFLGHGRFVGPQEIEVAGKRLRFYRALVATGARPHVPEIEGLESAGFLTNENLFTLLRPPARFGVVGGGPLGCEMAQAFARLGSQVTLLLRGSQLLPREEPEASELVRKALEADGVRIVDGAHIERVERDAKARTLKFRVGDTSHQLRVDEILIATGRKPRIEDLGLEAAGIEVLDQRIAVDDFLRTTNPSVYAVGDVASKFHFTHAADALARLAVRNALFPGRARASELLIPWCTFTSPEVARVGASRAELEARRVRFETVTLPLEENDRAVVEGRENGFLMVHYRRNSGFILGATLVAEHAGESIGELVLAMKERTHLGRLSEVIHPYPTTAECIRKAGDEWMRRRLRRGILKLFSLWFRRLERKGLKELEKQAQRNPH